MNIYTTVFTARCPANNRAVTYTLVIQSTEMIMVERIQSETAKLRRGYHEKFADTLFRKFGGVQTLSAHHHGTDVKTVRP